jgi:hypothetical protein
MCSVLGDEQHFLRSEAVRLRPASPAQGSYRGSVRKAELDSDPVIGVMLDDDYQKATA